MKHWTPTIAALALMLLALGCKGNGKKNGADVDPSLLVPQELKWSERMMRSEMHRNPEAWTLDFVTKYKWEYTHGLMLLACQRLDEKYPDPAYRTYIKQWYDLMIDDSAKVRTYDRDIYNIDRIKPGSALFALYDQSGDPRYRKVIEQLREQLKGQPRTTGGGFWHKKVYPHQMWLDGLYMGEPFYAEYTMRYDSGETAQKAYDDILLQFEQIQEHAKDPGTGLLYHGWDESREQAWADKETGTSPHFWGRAIGWYAMALVDVLDFYPEQHPGHGRLVGYLNELAAVIAKYRDPKTGVWYQVMDQGDRAGNYLEASASAMFTYSLAKGAKKGHLPDFYLDMAQKSFDAMLKEFVEVDEKGIVNLNQICGVAGLGGNPYRDGSYEYYVNELIRPNDPKGVGPFIMAALELDK